MMPSPRLERLRPRLRLSLHRGGNAALMSLVMSALMSALMSASSCASTAASTAAFDVVARASTAAPVPRAESSKGPLESSYIEGSINEEPVFLSLPWL